MKTVKSICFWALVLVSAAACSSNDDEVGDWEKSSDVFPGRGRIGAVSFTVGNTSYVGLGQTDDQWELQDFWAYNGKWFKVDSFPGEPRYGAMAFSDGEYGYVGCGYAQRYNLDGKPVYYKDFYRFDPKAVSGKQWTKIADFPGQARRGGVGFFLDGKGYVGTGERSKDDGGACNDYWSYDIATQQWSTEAMYKGDLRQGAVAWVIGKSAYICTGSSGTSDYATDFIKFTPSASEELQWEFLDPLKDMSGQGFDNDYNKIPRSYAVSFVVGKDSDQSLRVYLATGQRSSLLSDCWEFNPYKGEKGRWEEVTAFPTRALRQAAVSFVFNGYGYITVGGSISGSDTKQSMYKFYPGVDDDEDNDY